MANSPYTTQTISGYNSSPPVDDGTVSAANQVFWSTPKTKLADPIKTLAEAINTALVTAFGKVINTDANENNSVAGSVAFTESEKTISAGAFTAQRSFHSVDTEADAATDDLANIATGSVNDGALLILVAENAARVVTLKHEAGGAGQLHLANQQDITLDTVEKHVLLVRNDADWYELPQNNATRLLQVTSAGLLGVNEASPDTRLHVTAASAQVATFERTSANGGGQIAVASYNTDAKTAADAISVNFVMLDSTSAAQTYAQFVVGITDPTAGSEDGVMVHQVAVAGVQAERLRLGGTECVFNEDGADVDFRVESDGNVNGIFFDGTSGALFLNDSSNANMTVGLTINQGTSDNEILAFRSTTDVAHGLVQRVETTIYGAVRKTNPTGGGVTFDSVAEDDVGVTVNYQVRAVGGTASTTHTTAGRALVEFLVEEHDGADGLANVTADGNIFAVRRRSGGSNLTAFLIDMEGGVFWDDNTAGTAAQLQGVLDGEDDAALCRAYDMTRAPDGVIRDEWDKFVKYNEDDLLRTGILGGPLAEGGMTNARQLVRLHNGAIGQLWKRLMRSEQERDRLSDRLAALETLLLPTR